jgi:hypothetical protein
LGLGIRLGMGPRMGLALLGLGSLVQSILVRSVADV